MSKPLHIVLKFPNENVILDDYSESDRITEHKKVCEDKARVIWGQDSSRMRSGVANKNRIRIKDQIANGINTYSFFLGTYRGKKDLYVGMMRKYL
ncbi:hypothetical protein QNH39_18810 [Neobacillus novalis]|uniref:Uncharacterized protein n=1 Tax=Neobacillus novalis TaxID=220687 RepID=A0AA95S9E1_9BACI|nr:hypothetical protein [Neobacillus novalis]WHY84687.1 hypothetical protein QNH39_18810 [Neobacillus novalis]